MNKTILKIAAICAIAFAFSQAAMADDAYGIAIANMAKKSDYASVGGITTLQGAHSLEISSNDKSTAPRRSYAWDSDGNFVVNVVYSNSTAGKTSANGGSRSYFILPQDTDPSVHNTADGGFQVQSSGLQWNVSGGRPEVSLPPQCKGKVSPPSRQNQSGVEIQSCENKLVIDSGYGTASAASLNKAGHTNIRDPQGHTCVVTNSEIYKYGGWGGYDVSLKYKSSSQWASFLKGRCSNLNVSFLTKPASATESPAPSSSANPAPSSSSGGVN